MQSPLLVSDLSVEHWVESLGALPLIGTVTVFTVVIIVAALAIGIVLGRVLGR